LGHIGEYDERKELITGTGGKLTARRRQVLWNEKKHSDERINCGK
jgi:hypothetical protein